MIYTRLNTQLAHRLKTHEELLTDFESALITLEKPTASFNSSYTNTHTHTHITAQIPLRQDVVVLCCHGDTAVTTGRLRSVYVWWCMLREHLLSLVFLLFSPPPLLFIHLTDLNETLLLQHTHTHVINSCHKHRSACKVLLSFHLVVLKRLNMKSFRIPGENTHRHTSDETIMLNTHTHTIIPTRVCVLPRVKCLIDELPLKSKTHRIIHQYNTHHRNTTDFTQAHPVQGSRSRDFSEFFRRSSTFSL